ncbi:MULTISPECIES: hypothetical protein [Bradyrhizobium]|uniref:hypothetical protein n=1 Tax=Bradyrhizobium TaxID=374 RepID=UPI001EDA870B|nr:hypothetical protein [Bradyrhizobium zhengyangense]MCG2641714.1 hypothetical protein [Bradyrhizobium zhengyangense]
MAVKQPLSRVLNECSRDAAHENCDAYAGSSCWMTFYQQRDGTSGDRTLSKLRETSASTRINSRFVGETRACPHKSDTSALHPTVAERPTSIFIGYAHTS